MKHWGLLLLLQIFTINCLACPYTTQQQVDNSKETLQNQLFRGQKNDYAVFAQASKRFFTSIREISSDTLWLEITEFPFLNYQDRQLLEQQSSWKNVIHQLTSKRETFIVKISKQESCLFVLDPKTNRLHPISIKAAPKLLKLLNVTLHAAPASKLKMNNDNKPWRPQISLEGQITPYQTIKMYSSTWPQDGSLLSGNCILIYFTSQNISVFPIWTSIETIKGPMIIKTIDVGHHAPLNRALPSLEE